MRRSVPATPAFAAVLLILLGLLPWGLRQVGGAPWQDCWQIVSSDVIYLALEPGQTFVLEYAGAGQPSGYCKAVHLLRPVRLDRVQP